MSILLDKKRVAELMGISSITLDRLRTKGDLPYRQIGGLVRFTQEDIEAYIQKSLRNHKEVRA